MKINGWKLTAIISMVVATILLISSITLFYSIVIIDQEWAYEYEDLGEDWCEITNDMVELYNYNVDWLIYYDSEYWNESDKMEIINCEV